LQLRRGKETIQLELTASRLPASVPSELPPAGEAVGDAAVEADQPQTKGELTELKLPEFPNKCRLYVPAANKPGQLLGAVVWLQGTGQSKPEELIEQWKSLCDRDGLLLIVPAPGAENWERAELEYLRRLSERVVTQFKVDPRRMVVCGQGSSGAIAWPLALASRDLFCGAVGIASPLPRQLRVPPNDPAQRFAVFAAIPPKNEAAPQIGRSLEKLAEAGYNVSTLTTVSAGGELSDAERSELARWIDTLDRL
jgi:poly(3-hydroxybutyrate) depolymerase